MNPQVRNRGAAINSLEALDQAIRQIKACRSETEVDALLRPLLRYFDIESYVFIRVQRDHANRESFRYLIGCAPAWPQMYNAKKWFAIDPFVQYAAHNSAPEIGAAIKAESAGQSELLEAAAANGFRSSLIIPTHAGIKSHIGVFLLGSSKASEKAEPRMLASRNFCEQSRWNCSSGGETSALRRCSNAVAWIRPKSSFSSLSRMALPPRMPPRSLAKRRHKSTAGFGASTRSLMSTTNVMR